MGYIYRIFFLTFTFCQILIGDVILYSNHKCSYCKNVNDYLKAQKKTVKTIYIDNNPEARQELKDKGGKIQVPCLIVDKKPIYGSEDIIKWMKTNPLRLKDER